MSSPSVATAPPASGPGGPRLEARGITVRFGGLVALSDVRLSVPAGAIVGLVGPNGAGKSTLFGVLSGLLRPTSGTVLLQGRDVTRSTPQKRAGMGLARTFQHPELFSSLTVREHVVLAHRIRHAKGRIWSDLVTARGLRRAPRGGEENDRVDELVESLGLAGFRHRPAAGLPLGCARQLEVARALAVDPSVLLLDEPSSGLDAAETDQLTGILQRVVADRGVSLLLVEHDVELVLGMCHHVNVLDFGSMIASGPPSAIRTDSAVRAAYLGREVSEPAAGGIDLRDRAESEPEGRT